jgi:hypothetical protein
MKIFFLKKLSSRIVNSAENIARYLPQWEEIFSLNSPKSFQLCLIILLLYLGIVMAVLFSSRCIMIWDAAQDSSFLLEGAWRIICGQRIHTDFHSNYSFVFYSIIALGMKIGGLCGRALIYGPASVFPILSLWGWFIAKKRLSSIMSLLFSSMVGTIFIGNYSLGINGFRTSTYAMAYNRLGWSLFCILLLQLLLPPRSDFSAKRKLLEGLSIGAILSLFLFLKMNYFVTAFFALFLIPFRQKKTKYLWMGFAGAFFSISLFFIYIMKINLLAYVRDIETLSKINISWGLLKRILSFGLANIDTIILLVIIFVLLNLQMFKPNTKGSLSIFFNNLIAIFATILFGLVICIANYQINQIPLFCIGALFLCEDFLRKFIHLKNDSSAISENKLRYIFSSLLSAYMVLLIFLPDLGSVLYALRWRHICNDPKISELSRIDSETMKDMCYLVNPIRFIPQNELLDEMKRGLPENPFHYSLLLNDGIRLLKKHTTKNSRISVMDYCNIFSFPLGLPSPRGDRLDWVYGQTFNESIFLSPQEVFKEANLIMIRAIRLIYPDEKTKIYFPYVQNNFKKIDESTLWILYGR